MNHEETGLDFDGKGQVLAAGPDEPLRNEICPAGNAGAAFKTTSAGFGIRYPTPKIF